MYKKLLVAVDRGPISDRVVTTARDLAAAMGAATVVFHARETLEHLGVLNDPAVPEAEAEATTVVGAAASALRDAGVSVDTEVRAAEMGKAASEIVAAADRNDADLVVMGSHGRSALGHLLLGSTAYKVLHMTDRPVLVVR